MYAFWRLMKSRKIFDVSSEITSHDQLSVVIHREVKSVSF